MTRNCQTCRHAGWDPDGNYCAAPKVVEQYPCGRSLQGDPNRGLLDLCPAPEFPLHEPRKEDG